jgi:hypothetical protein
MIEDWIQLDEMERLERQGLESHERILIYVTYLLRTYNDLAPPMHLLS